jgi:hypothetical protein
VYPLKLSFMIEGEIKIFCDKQKPMELVTTKPLLQKILKGILHTEEEDKNSESTGKNNSH